jgi:hypothetical protein
LKGNEKRDIMMRNIEQKIDQIKRINKGDDNIEVEDDYEIGKLV